MLLVQNANVVFTMEGESLKNADILIKDGKIAALGEKLDAAGCEVLDASGLVALPGLVDAHTHHGGFGLPNYTNDNQDLNEMTNPITPEVQALHAVDIRDENFQNVAKCGVTTVCILPGSGNVMGGWAFVAKTSGKTLGDRVIKNPCAMKCAFGINPKGIYGAKNQMPMTRMGVAAILRQTLSEARHYMRQCEAAQNGKGEAPAYNQKHEALLPVLRGEIPLKMHCEQFDMMTAISIAKEFGCSYTLEHAWLANAYLDELSEGGGAINYGPVGVPTGYGELTGAHIWEVAELDKRGVCVSIISDAPIYSQEALLMQVGEAVRYGMNHERALRTVTINPAKALLVENRVGSLKVGKDADIALFCGMPAMDIAAKVAYTIQDGAVVYKAGR